MGHYSTPPVLAMSISLRLIAPRRERDLTQQEMADLVGLHVNQIRRYESEHAQPSLEALKKIAVGLSVSLDTLVFEDGERGPDDDLRLQFEAVSRHAGRGQAHCQSPAWKA